MYMNSWVDRSINRAIIKRSRWTHVWSREFFEARMEIRTPYPKGMTLYLETDAEQEMAIVHVRCSQTPA